MNGKTLACSRKLHASCVGSRYGAYTALVMTPRQRQLHRRSRRPGLHGKLLRRKHGPVGLTRALAVEYTADRLNAVCPGGMLTPQIEKFSPPCPSIMLCDRDVRVHREGCAEQNGDGTVQGRVAHHGVQRRDPRNAACHIAAVR